MSGKKIWVKVSILTNGRYCRLTCPQYIRRDEIDQCRLFPNPKTGSGSYRLAAKLKDGNYHALRLEQCIRAEKNQKKLV